MRKAAFHNLGCKVNSYETEAMQQLLEHAGYEIVPFKEGADVYVINTCSVTNIADKKSRQMLHRAKKLNPSAVVVAAGCYVQSAKDELKKDPAIDLIVGNNKKTKLVELLEEHFSGQESGLDMVIDIGATNEYENLSIHKISDHTRAFIKVQDGCNQFCTYCIIPYTRGRVRSRAMEDVIIEVRKLAEGGYKEVVLTGIHLSSYGIDFSLDKKVKLLELIEQIHEVDGIERIRFGSLEPRIITDEFVKRLASLKKVCPHFHLSLQSGCDATLKRMNRRYDTKEYLHGCEILRKYFRHPAITTDVIVGFPMESEEEFEATQKFLCQVGFHEMHVFKYSKRAGTRAADMQGQVEESVKNQRSDKLLALNKRLSSAYREKLIGEEQEVLLEDTLSINGLHYMVGYTKEYVKVAVSGENLKKGDVIFGVLKSFSEMEMMLLEIKKN